MRRTYCQSTSRCRAMVSVSLSGSEAEATRATFPCALGASPPATLRPPPGTRSRARSQDSFGTALLARVVSGLRRPGRGRPSTPAAARWSTRLVRTARRKPCALAAIAARLIPRVHEGTNGRHRVSGDRRGPVVSLGQDGAQIARIARKLGATPPDLEETLVDGIGHRGLERGRPA